MYVASPLHAARMRSERGYAGETKTRVQIGAEHVKQRSKNGINQTEPTPYDEQ
jgi:hypothetical protein